MKGSDVLHPRARDAVGAEQRVPRSKQRGSSGMGPECHAGLVRNEATGVNDRTDADPDVVADRCSLQDDRARCDVTGARCGEIQAPTGSYR